MSSRTCPNCGHMNFETAVQCDNCAFEFTMAAPAPEDPWASDAEMEPIRYPWLTIWYMPRGTIRYLVKTNPEYGVLLLAALSGIISFIDNAVNRSLGASISPLGILAIALIFGPIGGLLSLYIGGAVLSWVGQQLGGVAESEEVRTAIAWSMVPRIFAAVLLIPQFLIFGSDFFGDTTARVEQMVTRGSVGDMAALLVVFLIAFLAVGLSIWNLVILFKCISEVHRFSIWRAIATSTIPFIALVVLLGCCIGLTMGI